MSKRSLNMDLPELSILFYRSRFEVFPDENIHAEVWPQIMRTLQNWLEGKEDRREEHGKPNLYQYLTDDVINYSPLFEVTYQDCYLSESFANGLLTCECESSYLATKAVKGAGSDLVPQFWACDYIEQDSAKSFRRWRTNVGVTSSTSGTYVVNVRVAIYDDATFMGQAQIPERNTPNFISELLNIKNCVTIAGEIPLSSEPIPLNATNFDDFIDSLESTSRVTPIVVISAYWDGKRNVFDIDPTSFAKKMAGSAIVYTLDQSDYYLRRLYKSRFLEQDTTREFRIPNGGVRVFLPEVKLNDASDSVRHRFYSYTWLKEHNLEKVSDDICIGISKLYQKRADEVIDLFDVQLQDNKIKRDYYATEYQKLKNSQSLQTRQARQNNSDSTYEDLKTENERLWAELEETDKEMKFMREYIDFLEKSSQDEIGTLEERVKESQSEIDSLRNDNSRLQFDLADVRKTNEALSISIDSLERQIKVWDSISSFPSSPYDVVELAELLYQDRIVILDEAKTSAKEFLGDKNEVFQILKSVHHVLWPLLFFEKQVGNLEREFQNQTGYEMTLRETKSTQRDSKFKRQRVRLYNGGEIDITPHIKGSSGRRDAPLRVHFYKDGQNKKVVIGHCGEHLDTAGTRHVK